jgi:hypothetical protein
MSMVLMLAVVGMLIARSADPNTWKWFTGEARVADAGGDDPDNAAADRAPAGNQPVQQPQQPEEVTPGPTDLDPEEQEGVVEQFQALSDGATEIGREEMPAYWRLFRWTEHQTLAELRKRADGKKAINDFIQWPDENRGKLFRIELNVRQVKEYPAPENSASIEKVYEIWGTTNESQAWFYCVLTAHLPPGLPVGSNVHERVSFAGYFFKVMGYHAAGAGPKDKALPAPVFIGRISWKPAAPLPRPNDDPPWLWWLAGVFIVFAVLRLGLWFFGRSKTQRESLPIMKRNEPSSADNLQDWLAEAERDAAQGRAGSRDDADAGSSALAGRQRRPIDFRDN